MLAGPGTTGDAGVKRWAEFLLKHFSGLGGTSKQTVRRGESATERESMAYNLVLERSKKQKTRNGAGIWDQNYVISV